MTKLEKRTVGSAIDSVIETLKELDDSTKIIAVQTACQLLNIDIAGAPQVPAVAASAPTASGIQGRPPESAQPAKDIRSFKNEKKPTNNSQMACLVAYYLGNMAPSNERKTEINSQDIDKYFKQANHLMPQRLGQVLINAKGAGYMDSVKKGYYKLNPVGHNLVVHSMPQDQQK